MSEPGRVLDVPRLSLVVLIGASGSGKSTFAARHFLPTEVVSSDACRGMVGDDPTDQTVTTEAFELLHYIAGMRLRAGRLTVIDATNVRKADRAHLVRLGREHHALLAAIVFDMPEAVCQARNRERPDRDFGPHVVRRHIREIRRSLPGLRREGFMTLHHLTSPEEVESATIERTRLWNDHRDLHGPFDIVGDVHGCCDELEQLLGELGYVPGPDGAPRHPEGRIAILLGDLVDRGPRILDTVALVRRMVAAGSARCVPGNHDQKLLRALRGRKVQVTHGLDRSLAEVAAIPEERRAAETEDLAIFLDGLVSHLVLDEGRLVVAHAGLKEEMHGRGSAKVRDFALYGETTGETDEFGLPVRWDWAAEYRGEATVVYGHTPVPEPEWLNQTINIDTGCVFGGRLTALRYPERELVSVPARAGLRRAGEAVRGGARRGADLAAARGRAARHRGRPRAPSHPHAPAAHGGDPRGERHRRPRGDGPLRPRPALDRLPAPDRLARRRPPATRDCWSTPTRPSRTTARPACRAWCARRSTWARARSWSPAATPTPRAARFGVADGAAGACYTRTGRPFFGDEEWERGLIDRVREACEASGLFDRLESDWVLLDGELMPWSAKAQELLERQYAPVGTAARIGLAASLAAAEAAAAGTEGADGLVERLRRAG